MPRDIADIIYPLYLYSSAYARAPLAWKGSHLFALQKALQDPDNLNRKSFRDIHLFDQLAKIYMARIRLRSMPVLRTYSILYQFGSGLNMGGTCPPPTTRSTRGKCLPSMPLGSGCDVPIACVSFSVSLWYSSACAFCP